MRVQLTIFAIIHDAELMMLSEYFGWPCGLADLGEKVPKPEDVADLMDKRLELLVPVLVKHLRIQDQLVTASIGEEGTRQDAPANGAVIGLSHYDLEVPCVVSTGELDGCSVPPGQNRFTQHLLDRRFGGLRILEGLQ